MHYSIARYSYGKSRHSDWFLLGWDFSLQTVSMETVISHVFLFVIASKFKINKFDLSAIQFTLSLPQVTKTEFLHTISIQYQAGR